MSYTALPHDKHSHEGDLHGRQPPASPCENPPVGDLQPRLAIINLAGDLQTPLNGNLDPRKLAASLATYPFFFFSFQNNVIFWGIF